MARESTLSILKGVAPLAALVFYGVYNLPASFGMSAEEARTIEQSAYYSGCNEVRALGKAPLHAGQPGYREGMDGDGDGVACEPHRGY